MALTEPLMNGSSDGQAASASSSSAAAPPPVPVPAALLEDLMLGKKKKHKSQLQELRERLENDDAEDTVAISVEELETVHKALLKYKNRWLDAPALHFAVARWSTRDVQSILELKAKVDSQAKYTLMLQNGQVQHVHLHAIHVAAGLGKTSALKVLLDNQSKLQPNHSPANIFSRIQEGELDQPYVPSSWRDFYMPLHDAAWCGQKGTLRALVEAKADVLAINKDGKTALHLLVQAGHAGNPDIEDMLKLLLDADPDKKLQMLEAKTKPDIMPVAHRNLTPLELATAGGQFPPQLMHLLIGAESAIEGMLRLARVSMSATEAFANQIDQRDKFEVLLGCQGKHAVDKLATLLFKAPNAAVRMLDLLTVEPDIADPQHWPIPCSAVMTRASGWSNVTMTCQYQDDTKKRTHEEFHRGDHAFTSPNEPERTLLWPCWEFNSENFSHPDWHQELVRRVPDKAEPCDGVQDVRVKAVLLPGILDVDILWALARTRPKDYKIFARLAVKGVITCVWRGIIEKVYLLNVGWRSLEQLALVIWGFMTHSDAEAEEPPNQRASFPLTLCWALLLAAVIREVGESIVWVACHYKKKCQYAPKMRRHLHLGNAGDGALDGGGEESFLGTWSSLWRKKLGMSPEETVQWRSLWSMRSLLFSFDTCYFAHVLVTLSLLILMIFKSGLRSWGLIYGEEQIRKARVFLAFNVCLRFLGLLHMLRVCTPFGRKIVTACNSLVSLSMLEMAFTMCFIFSSIWCTFVIIVGREHRVGWVGLYLYRALIFGDGDGLENLGLSPDPEEGESGFHHTVMTFSMAAFGGLFQLVVLNLIVNPVYGSEYENIQQEADLVLQRGRAGYIVMYLMSKRPRHGIYQALDSFCKETFGDELLTMRQALSYLALLMLVFGFTLPVFLHNLLSVTFSALCIAAGQVLLNAAFMHSTWIGDIAGAGEDEHAVEQRVGSMPSQESFRQEGRFLWICYCKDYNEEWCVANDPIDKGVIETLSATMEQEMKSLREEVQELKGLLRQDVR